MVGVVSSVFFRLLFVVRIELLVCCDMIRIFDRSSVRFGVMYVGCCCAWMFICCGVYLFVLLLIIIGLLAGDL